jgi:hypothetical protein
MLDHIRRQVDACGLMPRFCQKAGEKARSGANIQNPQRCALGQVFTKFREPALLFLAFKFWQPLGLKALRPVGPIVGHAMLDRFHLLFLSAFRNRRLSLKRRLRL